MALWDFIKKNTPVPVTKADGSITTTEELYNELVRNSTGQPSMSAYAAKNNIIDVYQRNNIGYMCTNLVATNFASIDLILKEDDVEVENRYHPVLKKLRRPNPAISQNRMLQQVSTDLQLTGNAYLLRVNNKLRKNSYKEGGFEIHVLRPDRVRIVTNTHGVFPDRYEYTSSNGEVEQYAVDPINGVSDVLHLTMYNPGEDYIGLPVATSAYPSILIHNASLDYNYGSLKNGGLRKFIAWFKPLKDGTSRPITPDQMGRMRDKINEWSANRAGDSLVLPTDMQVEPLDSTPKDMEFLEGQREAARNIARAFGVPPLLLNIPGDNTYSNAREAKQDLYLQKIIPLMDYFCNEFSRWMSQVWGDQFEITFDRDSIEALSLVRETKSASVVELLNAGVIDTDEARAALGYSPKPSTVSKPEPQPEEQPPAPPTAVVVAPPAPEEPK